MNRRHVLLGQISDLANSSKSEHLEVFSKMFEAVSVDETTIPELVAFLAGRRLSDRLDNSPAEVISRLSASFGIDDTDLKLLKALVTQDALSGTRTGIRDVVYQDGGPGAFKELSALALDQVLDLLQIGGELNHGWGMRSENALPAFIGGKYYLFHVRLRFSGYKQLYVAGPFDKPELSGTGSTRVFYNQF